MRHPGHAGGQRHRRTTRRSRADILVFQGLRVGPKTSLKVLAPAPNSGVFDMA